MTAADLLTKWTRERDEMAFREIVVRYAPMVFSTSKRILGNAVEAEDVTQECFEALATARRPPRDHLGAWLHRVASNRCIDRIRTSQRRTRREDAYARLNSAAASAAHTGNPLGHHIAHSIALVTVMLNRAARATLNLSLTDKVEHSGDTFHMSTEKISAALTAFQILAREQRQWMRHLEHTYPLQPSQRDAGATDSNADPRGMGFQPMRDAQGGSRSRATAAHTNTSAKPHEDRAPTSSAGIPPAEAANYETDTEELSNSDDDCYDDMETEGAPIDDEWDELQRDIAEYDAAWEKRRHLIETPSAPKRGMRGPPMQPAQTVPASRDSVQLSNPHGRAAHATHTSPSRDLDRLRAKFIATLKEIQAKQPNNDPKTGPAP